MKSGRWLPLLIALVATGFGGWVLHDRPFNRVVRAVDRFFQEWLVAVNVLPNRTHVPITLVEMEDPANWGALEYSLFLKALPKENPPVVIFDSVPADGNSAFDRAFRDLAIKQPRLILPVTLSDSPAIAPDPWWLDGWKNRELNTEIRRFSSVEVGPSEALRGLTQVGIVNLTAQIDDVPRAQVVFALGNRYYPSQALRAAMLLWKTPPSLIQMDPSFSVGGQHLFVSKTGSIPIDPGLLRDVRRVPSSDLLLRLDGGTDLAGAHPAPLVGVVILGNLAEELRTFPIGHGVKLTRAEVIAASVATICNGPISLPVGKRSQLFLLFSAAFLPLAYLRYSQIGKWILLMFTVGIFLLGSMFFASQYALVLPLFMPVSVFLLSLTLNYFLRHYGRSIS